MVYRKIDLGTGLFIEDALFNENPVLMETVVDELLGEYQKVVTVEKTYETGEFAEDGTPIMVTVQESVKDPQYIDVSCPEGLYHPRWDGLQWVEGGQAPEEVIPEPSIEERLEVVEMVLMDMLV